MAVCSRPGPGTGQKAGEARGPSRPVFLLTLAVITSSSLSALSLYQLVVLREEVEGLKSEACRRREDGQEGKHGEQVLLSFCCRFFRLSPPNHLVYSGIPNKVRHKLSAIRQPTCTGCWPTGQNVSDGRGGQTDPQHTFSLMRRRRMASGTDSSDSLSCLQLLANKSRKIFRKDFALEPYTGIPWQTGLRKGSALETLGDNILIRQEGFYFVYSQVYYMDSRFAMGHVVIRRKRTVVGDEAQHVILFRCIQSMDSMYPYNTCYTGGVVKLEVGDQLELLIPRSAANVSLDGDSTFLGAIKLV